MNFKKTSIGTVCVIGDGAHASIKRVERGIAYLTSKNFNKEGINLNQVEYISEKDYQKHFRENSKALTKPKKGDLIFSIIGSIGGAYLYDSTDEFGLSSSVAIIRPNNHEVNSSYLLYYFKSSYLQKWVENIKSGSAQGFLSLEMIKRLPLILPPLPIQEKIGSILSAYDELIENNKQRIKLLEEIAEEIYKEWFVRLRFPSYENIKIIDGLPEGWEKVNAESIFNIKIGKTPPREETKWFTENSEGIKWVSIRDINNSSVFIFNTSEKIIYDGISKFNLNIAQKNTVILSFKLTVGKIAIATEDMVSNEAIAHFNIIDGSIMNREYIYCYLKNFQYAELGNTSSIGNAINSKIVKRMPIIKPAKNIINMFSEIIYPIFDEIEVLNKKNQLLQETRNLLLPRLISGKLSVDHLIEKEEEIMMAAETQNIKTK